MDTAIATTNTSVQRYLQVREHGDAALAASLRAAALDDCSLLFLSLRALRALPGSDAAALQASEQQACRFLHLLSSEGSSPPAAGGARSAPLPRPAPLPAPLDAEAQALASKRSTRNLLAASLAQLGAAAGTLAREGEVLDATGRVHSALAEDAAMSARLVRAWQEKERADLRWIRAAAYLLIATAAYLCLRRLAWVLGLRI
jgi:hypothetical protein